MGFYDHKNVLVTGGTGLIGRPLVELLLQAGAHVRVASMDDPSRCPAGAEFVQANLIHWETCQQVVKDMDYVFHLVGTKGSVGIGQTRAASFMVPHLLFNTHTMEAARQAGVERYLFTSSIAVYPPAQVFVEDDAWTGQPHPSDRFAANAKRIGELQAEAYKIEYGWDKIAIVRPANVYGPYDNFDPKTAMVVPALISRALSGENPFVVWGDGSAVRDFIYSRDCAEGMMLALERGANCVPVNLGSGQGASIKELVTAILASVENPPELVWDTSKPSGESIRLMDMTRAQEMLGFTARTSLAQGVRETVDWYRANQALAARRYNVFHQENYMKVA
jgi:GDP-L-fucose synthase